MFRLPLWSTVKMDAIVGNYSAEQIRVLDIHELAAGKLAALFARHASRDLFDSHYLLTHSKLDREKLRLGFVLYGAMNRKDWRTVNVEDISFNKSELKNQLLPVVRRQFIKNEMFTDWAKQMIQQSKDLMGVILPLHKNEAAFLDAILDDGKIKPELLTCDSTMIERITNHPLLQWKVFNVKQHKNK